LWISEAATDSGTAGPIFHHHAAQQRHEQDSENAATTMSRLDFQ